MKIREVIEYLRRFPSDFLLERSLGEFHSYRGDYHSLGVSYSSAPIYLADQIKMFEIASAATFDGYKGGQYSMTLDADVYLAFSGCEGVELRQHDIASWLFVWSKK